MKILMVNKFLYPRGGSESYMLALGKQFEACGHTVEYFGMADEQNCVGNRSGLYTQNMDFHSKGLSRFLYPFKILYSVEAKRKIGHVLDEFRPDVVHVNNINFQLTPSIYYAIKERNIPLVQTVHDFQMLCPNHLFYDFAAHKPCEKCADGAVWNCFKHKCIHQSRVKSLLGVLEAKLYGALGTYKKVDLYICPSKFLEKKLLDARAFYKGKTLAIHNFIAPPTVCPRETAQDYIFFAGRLSKEKGVELLAQTARLLPHRKFVVAGDGPDAAVLRGIENVEMPGFLKGEALQGAMANAAVLLAPSVCYENCPLSILEARALGVPAVTMPYGGMAELVEDGVTGTLAAAPTPQAVAEALENTLSDADKLLALRKNCLAAAKEILSVEKYCDILIDCYKELAERR